MAGTNLLIYKDYMPPVPGDALVTFDFNPKTWICGVPYEHTFHLSISYTIGQSTVSFDAWDRAVRTITQSQLSATSDVRFNVTAKSDTCSEGYSPPQVQVVVVVQQQNTRTLSAKSMHTVDAVGTYRLDISAGAIVSLAKEV